MNVRAFLALPAVFDVFQRLVGAPGSKRRFIEEFVRVGDGDRVLDIGCGTGALRTYMPPGVSYVGVDVSERYVAAARRRFGPRDRFVCSDIAGFRPAAGDHFDVAVAYGVFHHLDDAHARTAFALVREALKPDGRLVIAEPCFVRGQGRVESYLMEHDRGKFVRTENEYVGLAETSFGHVRTRLAPGTYRVPYTLVVLEATGGSGHPAPAREEDG